LKKDIKVIFWGCFGDMEIISLIDLPNNLESKKGGVIGHILLKLALKTILLQILDSYLDFIFIQDSASIH
jgi:hypothetical protein